MAEDQSFGYGQEVPNDSGSEYAAIAFVVSQMTARMNTMKLVQVKAVHGGGVAAGGTVDVLPLVQQIDGNAYGTPHGIVYGLPWQRIQGGKNAIICDPFVDDIGYVVASDRDVSKVKNQAPGFSTKVGFVPSTRRRFDIADGVYAGGCLNVAPEQYIIFTGTGIRIVDGDGNSVTMDNLGIKLLDFHGNSYASTAAGVNITDVNANQMQMVAGFVNFVTPFLKVNGVTITVP